MPVLANPKQNPKRTSFARMLAYLTFGFGTSTGATLVAPPTYGQSCDKSSGISSPSCGCEQPSSKQHGPKPCNCVRKPSVGEMFLSHLDRVGDQIEAKSNRTGKGKTGVGLLPQGPSCGCESSHEPSCGCEPLKKPSCGCEDCSRSFNAYRVPVHLPPIQSALLVPNGPTSNAAKGALVDKPNSVSNSVTGKLPVSTNQEPGKSIHSVEPFEPRVQRAPFEPRGLTTTPINRIPADEVRPTDISPSSPKVLKPIPTDAPPARPQNSAPPKEKSAAPTEVKLPDVLVDPFKDDVSSNNKTSSMIQLTSDRQIKTNSLRSSASGQANDEQEGSLIFERPARLTPKQKLSTSNEKSTGSLQFEASESSSNRGSQVVPSSYLHSPPVRVVVRQELFRNSKEYQQELANDAPNVSKIQVPARR